MIKFHHIFTVWLNAFLIRFAGRSLKLVQVVEYPKCGGTWVARLLRSYIGIDRKYGISAPVRRHAVLQTHQLYNQRYYKNIAVIRDPRDVWVSFYFHERYLEGASDLYGFSEEKSHAENMLAYMKQKLNSPEKSTPWFSYEGFLQAWQEKPNVCWLKYEDLQKDAEHELSRAVKSIGLEVDALRITAAVEANQFSKISGRKKGEEDVTSHKRKGIVGDWKNYFTREMGQLVHDNQIFIYDLGYEPDASWLEELE